MWLKRLWLRLRRLFRGTPSDKPKDIYPLW